MRAGVALLVGFVLVAAQSGPASAQAPAPSPLGLWRTFDDRTGRERGVVRIWERNGALFGSVVSTVDPEEGKRTCEKCTDDRKDQPIIGLNIIRGMRPDGKQWSGGEVLDPETGSIYRCSMRVEDGGRKLVLRGYLGISLLGRSQTWLRAG
jgi:uncharacterized protein (DUF2147 family)